MILNQSYKRPIVTTQLVKTIMKLKLRKIGNSLGITLNKEILDKLQVEEGDTIYVTETPDGVQLSAYEEPEFETVMKATEEITHQYRNAFLKLAK